MKTINRELKILLIEDKEASIYLAKNALKESQSSVEITVVEDGEKALKYLASLGIENSSIDLQKKPSLILIDADSTKISGFEILKYIKTHPYLRIIPTIILCSSEKDLDIIKSYKLQANAYIIKPKTISDFKNTVKKIESFWFRTAKTYSS